MSRFKQVLLAIAISIVFVFFVGFGIASFYKEPKYENFCEEKGFVNIKTKEVCEANKGKWTSNIEKVHPFEKPALVEDKVAINNEYLCVKINEIGQNITFKCQTKKEMEEAGYCDLYSYCRKEFENAREKYNRNVFIVATGIGIIALIIGFALRLASVSSGLMGGAILTIIYGTIRYWTDLPDYGRFIILGIVLFILLWLGYKRLKA
ncbi:hypothetical protein HYX01_00565 [Candidatus Woesearchaeota archaeon]|nr:hypothetical protein [Candidatus Woesearchaeota archaeon]